MRDTYATGMSKEMRADRLNVALVGSRERANDLEVLFGLPAGRQRRQQRLSSSHDERRIRRLYLQCRKNRRRRWLDFTVRLNEKEK